ncbi:MAG: undecaprenyl-phosphate glucose phosphotransferase [Clostridia bacterium]|nr:undecaprenyl-phosphate glucose phosphotransferase [Clostridia bacterium]
MRQNNDKTTALVNAFFDLIINIGSIYLAILIVDDVSLNTFGRMTVAISSICAIASIFVYFICDIYAIRIFDKLHKEIIRLAGAQLFINSVLVVVILMVSPMESGYYLLSFVGSAISFVALSIKKILTVKISHSIRSNKKHRKNVLLVGGGKSAVAYAKQIEDNPHYGYSVLGVVCNKDTEELKKLGNYDDLKDIVEREQPDEVVIAVGISDEPLIQSFIEICDNEGIRASIIPPMYKYFKSKCQVDMVGSLPVINTRDIPLDNTANAVMKRLLDIVVSVVMIILTSPVMFLAFLGVRLSSKGPVIFKQKRVGKNNKIFTIYKFRSMRVNDQEETGWTTPQDDRKTRFGAFMRKTGIDELPQLFNVLVGNMSIVGPRPELPNFVEEYSKKIPLYKVKHQVKPGITGLAQIYGFRGDTSIEGRIEMDIKYIENWSLFSDIKIMLITPFKMFNRNEKYIK